MSPKPVTPTLTSDNSTNTLCGASTQTLTALSALHLLEELAGRVAALGERRFLIAESDLNDPRIITPRDRGGYGIDAQWSDDFHHALHSLLTGEAGGYYADFGSLPQLVKALAQSFVYDGLHSRFRGRRHGRVPAGIPSQAFLAYAQNHDQVGNRARGERLSQLVSPGRLRIAAGLVLLGRFVPMIFQGEEWGAGTPFQFFNATEVIRDAIRRMSAEELRATAWRTAIAKGDAELDRGPAA